MASKRVWKPLNVGGLRLYKVKQSFPNHRDWDRDFIVAARSPSDATSLIEACYKDAIFSEGQKPSYKGYALAVYQPGDWWEDGVPSCPFDVEQERKEAKREGALAVLEAIKSVGVLALLILNTPEAKEKFCASLREAGIPCDLEEEPPQIAIEESAEMDADKWALIQKPTRGAG